MTYEAAENRYDAGMHYRHTGHSGLQLPVLSLGLWQNFGTDRPEETQRAILRRAFDRGVTHVDLANNYGPPYGRAEENFGRYLADDFKPYRDELLLAYGERELTEDVLYWALSPGWSGAVSGDVPLPPHLRGQ